MYVYMYLFQRQRIYYKTEPSVKFIIVKKYKYLFINLYIPLDHRQQGLPKKGHEVLISIRVPLKVYLKKILILKR